jgi:hypothetical protein
MRVIVSETEREREGGGPGERQRERQKMGALVCLCVHVCVSKRVRGAILRCERVRMRAVPERMVLRERSVCVYCVLRWQVPHKCGWRDGRGVLYQRECIDF